MDADVVVTHHAAGEIPLVFGSGTSVIEGAGEVASFQIPAPWPSNLAGAARQLLELSESGWSDKAFVAFPFDRSAAAKCYVPASLVERTVSGNDSAGAEPQRRTVESTAAMNPQAWMDTVESATRHIKAGELTKVVLAREVNVSGDHRSARAQMMSSMERLYPTSYRFCVDDFVGASPELLVQRGNGMVRAQPMAGTLASTGDGERDRRSAELLMGSAKNRAEHEITIDMVHDALLGWCSYLDAEPQPRVIPAGPVLHLATMVEGRLSEPVPHVLELVAALHPTPAVGGHPRSRAIELIAELEAADRGRYAGAVGWFSASGEGTFAVGIRSAEIGDQQTRLMAGVGVVADSEPQAELDETNAKLRAMLSVLELSISIEPQSPTTSDGT